MSVLALRDDGSALSLLLGLRRNSRDQLDVRIADGAQVYDGRRVWTLVEGPDGLSVADRVTGERVRIGAGPLERVFAVHQRTVWLGRGSAMQACSMLDGRCDDSALPTLPRDHPGPGAGFHVALQQGTLRLFLPQEQPGVSGGAGIPLATGISRLLGVYWVRGGTGDATVVANRTFRGRARVHALPRTVTVDGDLGDWATAAPMVVENPWHLQSGADGWSGPRDGSFSVAAVWSEGTVCLAGRVRDDHVTIDDHLTLRVNTSTLYASLEEGGTTSGFGEQRMVPTWLGAVFEACFPMDAVASDPLPFAVQFDDADPGEATTVLVSAPSSAPGPGIAGDGVPLGELILDAPP